MGGPVTTRAGTIKRRPARRHDRRHGLRGGGKADKLRERKFVEKWLLLDSRAPSGPFKDCESPDFLLGTEIARIGVDVTEIHPDQTRGATKSVSPQREREAFLHKVEQAAQKAFERRVSDRVRVWLFWANPLRGHAQHIGERVGDYLANQVLERKGADFSVGRNDYEDTVIEPWLIEAHIHSVAEGAPSVWASPEASFFGLYEEDFQHRINEKSAKTAVYRSKCNEIYLLIVIAGDATSTTGDITPSVYSHEFVSPFDRTIVLDMPCKRVVDLVTRQTGA